MSPDTETRQATNPPASLESTLDSASAVLLGQSEEELDQGEPSADDVERQGRRWLIWSFILCPCHLPVTLGILGAIVGGGAFGTLLSRDSIVAGVVLTTLYAIGLGTGLRHVRRANKLRSCSTGQCRI